jgi:hypothetical protein
LCSSIVIVGDDVFSIAICTSYFPTFFMGIENFVYFPTLINPILKNLGAYNIKFGLVAFNTIYFLKLWPITKILS